MQNLIAIYLMTTLNSHKLKTTYTMNLNVKINNAMTKTILQSNALKSTT